MTGNGPQRIAKRPCRRCGTPTNPSSMVNALGPVCAAMLGLTGSTLDIGHEGPDLLDLLAAQDDT